MPSPPKIVSPKMMLPSVTTLLTPSPLRNRPESLSPESLRPETPPADVTLSPLQKLGRTPVKVFILNWHYTSINLILVTFAF